MIGEIYEVTTLGSGESVSGHFNFDDAGVEDRARTFLTVTEDYDPSTIIIGFNFSRWRTLTGDPLPPDFSF